MFKKRIKVFAILFSILTLGVLSIIITKDEVERFRNREVAIQQIIRNIGYPEDIFGLLNKISNIRGTSLISLKWISEQIMARADFQHHSVYYFPNSKIYNAVLDSWMVMNLSQMNARHATVKEAVNYYRDFLTTSTKFYFPFPWVYYGVKLLIILNLSIIPLVFSLFTSFLTVKFSLSAATACLLLLTIMLRAQENMIEFDTSTTGGKHDLSLFIFHMDKKTTEGLILFEQGIWGWYGPIFKTSHGIILSPIGFAFGEDKNGVKPEYLSFLNVAMFKFGKITPMVMGFFNQAIVKGKSSFAWAKTVLYYDFSGFKAGIRADYNFWKENGEWRKSFGAGPIVKFVKGLGEKAAFIFQISATATKPYTLRTQWEVDF